MSLSTFVFVVILGSSSVLCLSLVKLNESQKVGLPSFMYSHFNISDVSGVASVMHNFFSNFKDSITEYVDSLSGSVDVPEAKSRTSEKSESAQNELQQKDTPAEPIKQVEVKKPVEQPKVVNTVQQKVKPEEKINLPKNDIKQNQKDETQPLKLVQKEQNSHVNVQKENIQKSQKGTQQNTPVSNTQTKKDTNVGNKLSNAKSDVPSPELKKVEGNKTPKTTNQVLSF